MKAIGLLAILAACHHHAHPTRETAALAVLADLATVFEDHGDNCPALAAELHQFVTVRRADIIATNAFERSLDPPGRERLWARARPLQRRIGVVVQHCIGDRAFSTAMVALFGAGR